MRLQRDSYAPKSCAFDAANVQFLRAHLCKSHPVLQQTVVHFVTHGGSGFGSSNRELREIAPKARFLKGLALYGEEVESSEAEIKTWLKELKFIK